MRGPIASFNEYAARQLARPPSRARQALAIALAVLFTAAVWDRRGVLLALLALLVTAVAFVLPVVDPERARERSRRYPVWDALLIGPLIFLTLSLSDRPLRVCLAIAVGTGIGLGGFVLWRQRRESSRSSSGV